MESSHRDEINEAVPPRRKEMDFLKDEMFLQPPGISPKSRTAISPNNGGGDDNVEQKQIICLYNSCSDP